MSRPHADGPVLVTGGAGFIGCNLVDHLASEGRDVVVYDALLRPGVERNLVWLQARHRRRIRSVIADIRDRTALTAAVAGAGAVFHFAAQVAVTTSLHNPIEDFEINLVGTLTLLEALRRRDDGTPLVFASTNKVYGDLGGVELQRIGETWRPSDPLLRRQGVSEAWPLDFHTPYGCSKGAADQYVIDYGRSFGVQSCVMRMSCIYGPRQMGTEDQGWVAHFLRRAMADEPVSLFGDGRQVRDVLHVGDAVHAYAEAERRIDDVAGQAFNLGGGPTNAVSLLQVLDQIEAITGRPVARRHESWRRGDQRYFVADTRAAARALDLPEPRHWRDGLADLHQWLRTEHAVREPALS